MKVSNLQQLLTELSRLLAAAGAAKQDKELAEFVRDLQPFAGETLAAFVKLAEKGKDPPKPPARTPKAPKATAQELSDDVYAVYDRPTGERATLEAVESLCDRLTALPKADLVGIADRIALFGANKHTKPKIIDSIRHQLRERIGTAARREMMDRPSAAPSLIP